MPETVKKQIPQAIQNMNDQALQNEHQRRSQRIARGDSKRMPEVVKKTARGDPTMNAQVLKNKRPRRSTTNARGDQCPRRKHVYARGIKKTNTRSDRKQMPEAIKKERLRL